MGFPPWLLPCNQPSSSWSDERSINNSLMSVGAFSCSIRNGKFNMLFYCIMTAVNFGSALGLKCWFSLVRRFQTVQQRTEGASRIALLPNCVHINFQDAEVSIVECDGQMVARGSSWLDDHHHCGKGQQPTLFETSANGEKLLTSWRPFCWTAKQHALHTWCGSLIRPESTTEVSHWDKEGRV